MKGRKIKLRGVIAAGVLLITLSLACALLVLDYLSSAAAVRVYTRDLLIALAEQVAGEARGLLDEATRAVDIAAAIVTDPDADDRLAAADMAAFDILAAYSDLSHVQCGLADGGFARVQRQPAGGFESMRIQRGPAGVESTRETHDPGSPRHVVRERRIVPDDDYDPRTRPWYRAALATEGISFTDVYLGQPDNRPVVAAARAVAAAGGPGGVVSAAISLQDIEEALARLTVRGRPVHAFVVDARGRIVAAGGDAPPVDTEPPRLADSAVSDYAAVAATPEFATALERRVEAAFAFTAGGRRRLAVVRPLAVPGVAWLAGAVVAEEDFLGEVRAGIARNAAVSLAIIAGFLTLAFLLGNSVSSSLRAIAEETGRLRALDLDERPMPDTIFEEIADITTVYGNLKAGLRGFQKYVPWRLVRGLLSEGVEPQLGGRAETLTILFSDLEGFTTFAEAQPPDALGRVLGDYLAVVAGIIAEEGGTVDKFIGDAVMAFWNAPRPVPDHAVHAVAAAVRCRDSLADRPDALPLRTRFGLHTAHVVVGNFGAPDRFSYTALGDGVNLAARLEGINDVYGTSIVVSTETRGLVADRFECRRLDRIAVKGKRVATEIHEVLGVKGQVPETLLRARDAYEAALAAYLGGDFARAGTLFAEALTLRPDDTAAGLMRSRSAAFAADPPPPGWDGVFVMRSK